MRKRRAREKFPLAGLVEESMIILNGSECTVQHVSREDTDRDKLAQSGGKFAHYLCKILDVYFSYHHDSYCMKGVYLHDPTALLAAVNPSLITYTEGALKLKNFLCPHYPALTPASAFASASTSTSISNPTLCYLRWRKFPETADGRWYEQAFSNGGCLDGGNGEKWKRCTCVDVDYDVKLYSEPCRMVLLFVGQGPFMLFTSSMDPFFMEADNEMAAEAVVDGFVGCQAEYVDMSQHGSTYQSNLRDAIATTMWESHVGHGISLLGVGSPFMGHYFQGSLRASSIGAFPTFRDPNKFSAPPARGSSRASSIGAFPTFRDPNKFSTPPARAVRKWCEKVSKRIGKLNPQPSSLAKKLEQVQMVDQPGEPSVDLLVNQFCVARMEGFGFCSEVLKLIKAPPLFLFYTDVIFPQSEKQVHSVMLTPMTAEDPSHPSPCSTATAVGKS
ncbi:hypothetical protein TEA_018175 [Camellia sinensis var. sinensis]|uniref:Uncharacterized protein n=1 Tax=Camellia sinensis var. sinensis TaxID=542762 RepID=A0A4S4D2F4_CAMSN|nr:hypothetical protein TEA_018175 [Camellia sinensis var. sinensis]